jgi:uncharacterized protein YyaL (SSP411 family)
MLIAFDFHLGPTQEIAVVGDRKNSEVAEVLWTLRQRFRPRQVLAWKSADDKSSPLPLLRDRPALGSVTTYVCENFACQAPIVGVKALHEFVTRSDSREGPG